MGVLLVANVGVAAVAQWRTLGSVELQGLAQATVLPLALGALLVVIQALVVLAFPVRVLPDALQGFNLWGGYKTVKWGDIPEVSAGALMRMRYLKVPVPASPLPITVPLLLADLPGFLAAVETRAGPEHPLAVALRQEMGPAGGDGSKSDG
ncbi:hypothetical protein [Roseateles terrae]|uniref:PH domain-containing protein n=1 Tax=Roseateles terrae TaxID=431060 RepID=A0ABR6H0H0_9BURK|nr:hypothetical protein [Roseateles terrae]MBB3197293.1 hypothetical protein [Roseateles terrae]OWQ83647.1 hypothetical protein CDN98_21625 [Roseateles terrae]